MELSQAQRAALRAYKSWTLVNPVPEKVKPVPLGGHIWGLTSADPIATLENDPHKDMYVSVYVNEAGRHAMLAEKKPVFPAGSVIVLENRKAMSDPAPALLTVMVKHEREFAPDRDDWEFLLLDGSASQLAELEKLAHCWSCHLNYPETDRVARRYLPKAIMKELR
jgi:hypothetical protein